MTSEDPQPVVEPTPLAPPPPPPTAPATAEVVAPPPEPVVVPEERPAPEPVVTTEKAPSAGSVRAVGIIVMIAGVILLAAGTVTWFVVGDQLGDEKIVVSSDADRFAGDKVDGPLTAYSEAETIQKHALEAGNGKTYAELPQDDPARDTVMTASFLRASLFTSVVSFGVALFAAGMGLLMILVGYAILRLGKLFTLTRAPAATTP